MPRRRCPKVGASPSRRSTRFGFRVATHLLRERLDVGLRYVGVGSCAVFGGRTRFDAVDRSALFVRPINCRREAALAQAGQRCACRVRKPPRHSDQLVDARAAIPLKQFDQCCVRFPCVRAAASTPVQRLGVVFARLTRPYQPSPKLHSGRPAHRPFRGLLGDHSRCGPSRLPSRCRSTSSSTSATRALAEFSIESFATDDRVDLGNSMVLELRDLSRPELVYSDPFDSHVVLAQADFGPERISKTSGRVKAFFWPSMVRIGPEASRFQEEAGGRRGGLGHVEPQALSLGHGAGPPALEVPAARTTTTSASDR